MSHDQYKQQSFDCQKCPFEARNKSKLIRHQIEAHGDSSFTMYKCSKCDYDSLRKESVKQHEHNAHTDQKKFGCKFCEYTSNYRNMFRLHMFKKHQALEEAEPFKCPHCPFVSFHRNVFERHVLLHDERRLVCQECSFKADNKGSLFRHQIETHGKSSIATYKCSECDYEAVTKDNVKQHEHNSHTDQKKFGCEFCEYTSNYKGLLKLHLFKKHQVSEGAEPFKCPHCPFNTPLRSDLKRHTLLHDKQPLVFICQECSFKADKKSLLFKHQNEVHGKSSIVTYKCSKCDYEALMKNSVKQHEHNAHTDQKRFGCHLCEFSSNHKNRLQSHLFTKHQIVDGVKPSECPHCSYSTLVPAQLKKHLDRHKEPLLSCQKCSFKITKKSLLYKHEIEAHGETSLTTYKCSECEFTSCQQWTLRWHEKSVHKDLKAKFKSHLLDEHQIADDVTLFKCPHCEYQGFCNSDFRRHVTTHQEVDHIKQEVESTE